MHSRRLFLIISCAVWISMAWVGFTLLWNYENAPGPIVIPPPRWPTDSRINLANDRFTLILLAHPRCPCTRASIGELAKLMARTQDRLAAFIVFFKPAGYSDDWENTDLWQSAASIPGVNVVLDEGGIEARRFHALTSGQTLLYDSDGVLMFSGGITGSRGHSGDNAGESAIVSLLNTGEAELAETFAFGCPLFSTDSECQGSLNDRNKH